MQEFDNFPSNIQWGLIGFTLIAYALLWWLIYKTRHENDQDKLSKKLARLSTPPLILHCLLLITLISQKSGLYLGLVNIGCLIAWLMASMTVSSSLYRPTINLCLFAFPLAMLSIVLVVMFPTESPPLVDIGIDELMHITISILSFSIFSIAAAQAVFIAILDYQLHHRLLHSWHNTFPPLETLEKSLFEMISLGLILLTLSIATGFLFLDNIYEQHVAHKMLLSIISWMVFSILLMGRIKFGWRGSRAVQFVIAGYALLFLAYIGSKFVLEIILERV